MENLSPSKINKYYQCGYSFYCSYVAHNPQIKTPDASLFGQMIHNIVVNYYGKVDEHSTPDDIVRCIEEAFTEGADYRLEGYKADWKRNQESFRKFEFDRLKKKIPPPLLLEKSLKAELFPGLPPIEGRIDAYWEIGLWTDWKTGNYESITPERMIQGKIYELLLEANGFPVKEGKFVNLTKDMISVLPKVTSGWVESKVRTMVDRVEKGIFPANKSPLCNGWCGFRARCDIRGVCPWKVL
jgi:hypothetical protein